MPLDIQDLNPVFAQKLAAMLAAAQQSGIDPGYVNSAYRSVDTQNQLYQNHLAKVAGQALPFPNQEAPSVVAPPGGSMHNFGLATDITSPQLQKLRDFTAAHPEYGIATIGPNDPGHFQLAGNQRQLMANPPTLVDGANFDTVAALTPFTNKGTTLTANLAPATQVASAAPIKVSTEPPPPDAYGYASSAPNAPTGTTINSVPSTNPPTAVAAAPAVAAPDATTATPASLLAQGNVGGALGAIGNNKDLMGQMASLSSTLGGGGQKGQQAPQTLPVPQLQDNSAQIAANAPQMLASLVRPASLPPIQPITGGQAMTLAQLLKQRQAMGMSLGGFSG